MTLIELLIAMVVTAVGISAIVAGFSSGILAINRSAKASVAGAFADQQMEAYRRLSFSAIATDTAATAAADARYSGDPAHPTGVSPAAAAAITATCPGIITTAPYYYCNPSRTATGTNGGSYRIDSYVGWACVVPGSTLGGTVTAPTCSIPAGEFASRAVKKVTVVVRNGSNLSKTLVRVTTTFDTSSS